MAAHESLGPQFLYHEAPVAARESIQSKGLQPGEGHEKGEWRDGKWQGTGEYHAPPGVYMSPAGHSEYSSSMASPGRLKGYGTASHYGYDRWRVATKGLNVQIDPSQPQSAHYTEHAIPPEHLKLVAKADPNWERNI
jgi:hypothetical protein